MGHEARFRVCGKWRSFIRELPAGRAEVLFIAAASMPSAGISFSVAASFFSGHSIHVQRVLTVRGS